VKAHVHQKCVKLPLGHFLKCATAALRAFHPKARSLCPITALRARFLELREIRFKSWNFPATTAHRSTQLNLRYKVAMLIEGLLHLRRSYALIRDSMG
jgi:hypothetical protein